MATYYSPGVYIEEISKFPPSVVAVATAVPAFIGYTEKAEDESGNNLNLVPTRITSMLEFEASFGMPDIHRLSVNVKQTQLLSNGPITATTVSFDGTPPSLPSHFLHYSMKMFFDNGGGPCYVVSIGDFSAPFNDAEFTIAINELEKYDEPTLLVFPDACLGTFTQVASIIDAALSHCSKMQDRFTIADVHNAVPSGTNTNAEVTSEFRGNISSDLEQIKYGAAYFPYLDTKLPFYSTDDHITVIKHTIDTIQTDGSVVSGSGNIVDNTLISHASVKEDETAVYNAIKAFITANATVTLPPSGAIAGVYARVDSARGVWKAPANVSIADVFGPAINMTKDLNDNLNIDATSGKSVNALRAFTGKGTLVWGARTLAGNDNEWRYVPVRRFFIMVEESVKKATAHFVFEPNDANTWVKVRSMIENFLTLQWRAGALAGAKPEEAFYVKVGLNQTMTAQDILDGYMIIEIGMAAVRPAEFIILRFSHKMQES